MKPEKHKKDVTRNRQYAQRNHGLPEKKEASITPTASQPRAVISVMARFPVTALTSGRGREPPPRWKQLTQGQRLA